MAKILLVEDNELNRDMLSRRLERRGFEVLLAFDGQEGVDKALAETPDLVLMDMDLPVVDGWDATRLIRANPRTASIPVIALTAHALVQDRERALRSGCNAYHSKPVDFAELLLRIDELLAPQVNS